MKSVYTQEQLTRLIKEIPEPSPLSQIVFALIHEIGVLRETVQALTTPAGPPPKESVDEAAS